MSAALDMRSSPTLSGFSPDIIAYQREVIDLVRWDYDYTLGNLEILLSGSYGSAKSTLLAHLAVTHCLLYPGAVCGIGRRARDDIKKTIWKEILDHIAEDLVEGVDYTVNLSELRIEFSNGAAIESCFWGDKRYMKFRSRKFSMLIIEEIVENDEDDQEAFRQLKARLRRIPGIPENVFIAATNPGPPTHWVHRYFIAPGPHPTRRVFYSRTEDNPFIDPVYVQQLRADLSPKEARRYLDGQWIELTTEVVYYEYQAAAQFRASTDYTVSKTHPVGISFDFNIGEGKPMSAVMFQYVAGSFHFFNEVVIEGVRTADILEEWDARGALDVADEFILTGDASGKNRDTRSSRSDYDIIRQELAGRGKRCDYRVPTKNPPVRSRHNRVNAHCKNDQGDVRLFLYKGCVKLDEGMRLVRLKRGADYLEDDSKDYQHSTTALGYAVMTMLSNAERKPQGMVQL
ncbi:MAG TPA: phage terminase large subunit [Rubrobacter sp.]|nr:phage terminase large subunit [Rubrobacter sp.]